MRNLFNSYSKEVKFLTLIVNDVTSVRKPKFTENVQSCGELSQPFGNQDVIPSQSLVLLKLSILAEDTSPADSMQPLAEVCCSGEHRPTACE